MAAVSLAPVASPVVTAGDPVQEFAAAVLTWALATRSPVSGRLAEMAALAAEKSREQPTGFDARKLFGMPPSDLVQVYDAIRAIALSNLAMASEAITSGTATDRDVRLGIHACATINRRPPKIDSDENTRLMALALGPKYPPREAWARWEAAGLSDLDDDDDPIVSKAHDYVNDMKELSDQ
jgi:hypothetical protein